VAANASLKAAHANVIRSAATLVKKLDRAR